MMPIDGLQITFTHIGRNPSNSWGHRRPEVIGAEGTGLTVLPVSGVRARMRPTP